MSSSLPINKRKLKNKTRIRRIKIEVTNEDYQLFYKCSSSLLGWEPESKSVNTVWKILLEKLIPLYIHPFLSIYFLSKFHQMVSWWAGNWNN